MFILTKYIQPYLGLACMLVPTGITTSFMMLEILIIPAVKTLTSCYQTSLRIAVTNIRLLQIRQKVAFSRLKSFLVSF